MASSEQLQELFLANKDALDLFLPRVFSPKSSSIPHPERIQTWNVNSPIHSVGNLWHQQYVQTWMSLWRPGVEAHSNVSEDKTTPYRGQVSHQVTNPQFLTQMLPAGITDQ